MYGTEQHCPVLCFKTRKNVWIIVIFSDQKHQKNVYLKLEHLSGLNGTRYQLRGKNLLAEKLIVKKIMKPSRGVSKVPVPNSWTKITNGKICSDTGHFLY